MTGPLSRLVVRAADNRRPLLLATGLCGLAVAALAVAAPGALGLPLPGRAGAAVVVLVGLFGGVLGLVVHLWFPGGDGPDPDIVDRAPESAYIGTGTPVGGDVDDLLDRYDELSPPKRARADRVVRRRLRGATVTALTDQRGVTSREARALVESGGWTDDPLAAAFLAPGDVDLPLVTRVREWARGDRFVRGARAAATELGRVAGSSSSNAGGRPDRASGESSEDGAEVSEEADGARDDASTARTVTVRVTTTEARAATDGGGAR